MSQITALHTGISAALPCAKLIAVASGKGGVGKTWLSAALTHALANQGRRSLLFDGDLGLANVDIQLGLTPERDLGAVLAGQCSLADAITPVESANFDVIAGRSGSGSLANLPANKLAGLSDDLVKLTERYDDVVIDLGAGIERTVRHLAGLAATCLVITTDEPTSLTDAYAFIKLTLAAPGRQHPLGPSGADLRVVVNMAGSRSEGERTYGTLSKACATFLKANPPLAGIIPRDAKVKDAIRHQTPILQRHPGSPAAKAIEVLAQSLRPNGGRTAA
ncbi:MAG: MinD/ParA family protein [Kiloniellales bacterium]